MRKAILVILVFLVCVSGVWAEDNWISPTGHNDPSGDWQNPANAYDGNIETSAYFSFSGRGWGSYIEFTFDEILCDKVRVYAYSFFLAGNMQIDYYNGDSWVNFSDVRPINNAWTELFIGSAVKITKIRLRSYTDSPTGDASVSLYEIELNKYIPPTLETYDTLPIKDIATWNSATIGSWNTALWQAMERYKFTIDHTLIGEDLTHFPVTVILRESTHPEFFERIANADDFDKVTFYNDDGLEFFADCEMREMEGGGEVLMGNEDLGTYDAIYGSSSAVNLTAIDGNNPAITEGIITNVGINLDSSATGVVVFTAYETDTNMLTTRDYQLLGNVASGVSNHSVNLEVKVGDYIGIRFSGAFRRATTGTGYWWGNDLPSPPFTNQTLTWTANRNPCINATIEYEIEPQAVYHISHPDWTISKDEDTIYYLGFTEEHNTGSVGLTGSEVAQKVWNKDYAGVWHMVDGTATTVLDATSNNNHGTKGGNPQQVAGQVGYAQRFDGVDDYIDTGYKHSLSAGTIEQLVSFNKLGVFQISGWQGATNRFYVGLDSVNRIMCGFGNTYNVDISSNYNIGEFHSIAMSGDGSKFNIFSDGVVKKVDISYTYSGLTGNIPIGARNTDNVFDRFVDGLISEFRISKIGRSSHWISATYHSLFDTLQTSEWQED